MDEHIEPITIRTSPTLGKLAAALAKSQGAFTNPERNREVTVRPKKRQDGYQPPDYKFKYATLDSILEMARPILGANGLAIIQVVTPEPALVTRLIHESDEWIEGSLGIHTEGAGMQALGAAITYLKRYCLSSMLGIAADEDDDGNAADGNDADVKPRGKAAAKSKPLTGGHAPPAVVGKEPAPVDPPETKATESAFQAAVGKIAMTFTHPELDKLTQRLVDSVKLDEKEKTALLGLIKGQRLKADEAEKQANANTAA